MSSVDVRAGLLALSMSMSLCLTFTESNEITINLSNHRSGFISGTGKTWLDCIVVYSTTRVGSPVTFPFYIGTGGFTGSRFRGTQTVICLLRRNLTSLRLSMTKTESPEFVEIIDFFEGQMVCSTVSAFAWHLQNMPSASKFPI